MDRLFKPRPGKVIKVHQVAGAKLLTPMDVLVKRSVKHTMAEFEVPEDSVQVQQPEPRMPEPSRDEPADEPRPDGKVPDADEPKPASSVPESKSPVLDVKEPIARPSQVRGHMMPIRPLGSELARRREFTYSATALNPIYKQRLAEIKSRQEAKAAPASCASAPIPEPAVVPEKPPKSPPPMPSSYDDHEPEPAKPTDPEPAKPEPAKPILPDKKVAEPVPSPAVKPSARVDNLAMSMSSIDDLAEEWELLAASRKKKLSKAAAK